MTMVEERTAAVVHTREFLKELSGDQSLPDAIRLGAKHLLRHFPEAGDIWLAGRLEERRREELSLLAEKHGPLHPALVACLVSEPMFCDEALVQAQPRGKFTY
jgi:hypothetical protein